MLDDERYGSAGDFPPIISKEMGSAITSMRKQKATTQSSIIFIQKKLVCCSCGEKLRRIKLKSSRIHWTCKKCDTRFSLTTDHDLLQAVTDKLLIPCHNPEVVGRNPPTNNSLSIQAARLTNKINQAMNQRKVDPNELLPLILECAAEKYKTAPSRKQTYDHYPKSPLQAHSNDTTLDRELFERAVKQVILQPTHLYSFVC